MSKIRITVNGLFFLQIDLYQPDFGEFHHGFLGALQYSRGRRRGGDPILFGAAAEFGAFHRRETVAFVVISVNRDGSSSHGRHAGRVVLFQRQSLVRANLKGFFLARMNVGVAACREPQTKVFYFLVLVDVGNVVVVVVEALIVVRCSRFFSFLKFCFELVRQVLDFFHFFGQLLLVVEVLVGFALGYLESFLHVILEFLDARELLLFSAILRFLVDFHVSELASRCLVVVSSDWIWGMVDLVVTQVLGGV